MVESAPLCLDLASCLEHYMSEIIACCLDLKFSDIPWDSCNDVYRK
jgi:hypothetical protein